MNSIHAMAPLSFPAGADAREAATQDCLGTRKAQGAAAAQKAPEVTRAQESGAPAVQERPLRPDRDEYCPGEPEPSTGRYWPEKDAEGRRVVRTDALPESAPQKPQPAPDMAPAAEPASPKQGGTPGPEKEAAAQKEAPQPAEEERCTVSTDKVDREIKTLKQEKARLEQQLQQGPSPQKEAQLNQKLQQVEEELRQKDNDAYRRQHAEYSMA